MTLADGKVVGRILEEGSRFGPPELRWGWSLFIVPATPGVTNGTAATREEAMAKFRAAWTTAKGRGDGGAPDGGGSSQCPQTLPQ
jgi:hypothetical protein